MFDHIYFEVYMVIHSLAIAHFYVADRIVKGNGDEQFMKDIIKEASN